MKYFCKLYQEGVENCNIPEFQFRHVDKNLQRESRLWVSTHCGAILAPWTSVTGNFSFQNRPGCVCLNAIGNRRSVWWCLVIDMNDHLFCLSLYKACCKSGHSGGIVILRHVMPDGEKILYKRSISCGLLLRQSDELKVVLSYRHLNGRMADSTTDGFIHHRLRDGTHGNGSHIIFWVI